MTIPPLFYYAVAIGLVLYMVKKYIAGDGWNFHVFLKNDLAGFINSIVMTGLAAYMVPELVIYASDTPKLIDIATKYPQLVIKTTVAFGMILGFTGGSIGYDLFPLLYNLPIIGPYLKKIGERLLSKKADRMAEDRGIDTGNP